MLKKIISIMLTVLLLLSCSSAALAWTGLSDATDSNIVRIGVISDTHQKFDGLQTAANAYYALDSSLDGLIFAGDIIYMQNEVDISLYDALLATEIGPENGKKTIATLLEEDFISFAMGNHETPLNSDAATMVDCAAGFETKTGEETNSVKTFGGYRVISISPNDYNGNFTDETANYLKAQVDDALANTTGPVFINIHFGFHDTVFNTESYGFACAKFSDEGLAIVEEIKKNPRVIVVSGHTHESNYDPRTIYQQEGGFTAVENSVISGGTQTFSQGLLLEINKTTNVVTIRRLDFKSGTYIGEPWVVNTDGTNQLYTDAAREAAAGAPAFPQGATVTAVPYETTAMLTVTTATKFADTETDFAYSYKVTYTNEVTGVSQVKTYSSDFYKATQADSLEFKLDNLSAGTEYSVSVTAVSPYGKESATSVSTTFETEDPEFTSITLENVVTKDVSQRSGASTISDYTTTCGIAGTNYVEFEFDIATSGYYRISTQLGAGETPTAKLFVDGDEKASRTISQGSWDDYKQEMIWADVWLEAGTRTMKFQRTGGSSNIRFYTMSVGKIPDDKIDPVKLGYSVSQTVAEALEYNPSYWKDEYTLTTDTEIDESKTYYTLSDSTYTAVAEPVLDDIATYYEKTRSHGNAHNQNWGSYFVVMKSNDWNTTFKLTPEFSGVYDISLKVGLYSTSTYTVDSVVTVTETRTGLVLKADSSTTTTSDATHTVGTFTKNGIDNDRVYRSYGAVALEAGKEYTIVFDNTSTGDYYALLDAAKITAISFDPSVHNLVTTTYAGESTSDSVATGNKYGTGAPNSNYGWSTTQHYMQFNVFVPVDAKYDIYAMGGSDGENNIHYTIQGQYFVAPFANTVLVAGETNSGFNNNRVERLLTAGVNLKKGTYTVYLDITDSTGGALNFRAFTLKSVGEYSSDNTTLSAVSKTVSPTGYDSKTSSTNASHVSASPDGLWLTAANHYAQWNDRYFTAGTYKVYLNYSVYSSTKAYAYLNLDERPIATTKLATNAGWGTPRDKTTGNGTPLDLTKAYTGYVATVRLDEGYHTIKIGAAQVEDKCGDFSFNYVKFVPITEPMAELFNDANVNLDATATEIQDGAMTLRANLPKTDLGKTMNVIFAIYETSDTEGALPELYTCAIKEVTVDKNYRAILTIPNIVKEEGKTYSYKVFYWDNLDNVRPLY